MRREEFTPDAPGQLVPIPDGWAFVPAPLPPDIPPSWELVQASERAGRALGELLGQARLVANDALIMGPLLTREAVESNRIEGTHTLIEEVLLQRAAGPPRDAEKAVSNLEVLRYIETLNAAARAISEGQPLSHFLLRSMHSTLLEGTRGQNKSPGVLRTGLVGIGRDGQRPTDVRFIPPPPEHVAAALDNFFEFVRSGPSFGPLIACAVMHYQFETIHPFEDGNGRLGRLLIPVYLLAQNVIDRPILYLSSYLESHRDEYVNLLKRVSTHGDWLRWVSFFLEAVRYQAADARDRVDRVLALHERYRELVKANSRTQAPLTAVDVVMERVYVSIPEVAAATKRDYRTAKAAIETLAQLGIVSAMVGSYPQRWVARELLDHVYQS